MTRELNLVVVAGGRGWEVPLPVLLGAPHDVENILGEGKFIIEEEKYIT